MSDNETQLQRASIPLIFEDGTQLLLKPLGDRSETSLNNWVKARYLHDQRSNIPEGLDNETKDRIERIAQQTAATLCWYLGLGSSIMVSIDGMAQIIYEAAKENHPNITPEEIRAKLFQGRNLDLANEAFSKTEGLEDELKNRQVGQKVQMEQKGRLNQTRTEKKSAKRKDIK